MTEVSNAHTVAGSVREALPKPCLGCGAPMAAVEAATGLHTDPTLVCRFCGRSETMPADAAAQYRFLQLRLMQVRRSREALEAPLKTFEAVQQSWAIGLVAFAAIAGWQLWQALTVAGQVPLESTLFALAAASAVVGVICGYFGMNRAFKTLVRPLLKARPPIETGLSIRCRTCGGDLPRVRAGQVQCGFCGASNFLDAWLAEDVSRLLANEQAEYQRRAQGEASADGSRYQEPAKAFYRWAVRGAAATFIVAMVLVFACRG